MGLSLPQTIMQAPENLPYRALSAPVDTTAPTTATKGRRDGHGVVPDSGIVCVEVDAACVLSIYTYMHTSSKSWLPPGSNSDSYQKTFAAAGYDYFVATPGSVFYLVVASGTVNAWVAAEAPPQT